MAKRLRIGYNGDYTNMDARRKRAIAIAAKIRNKYPYSEYGRSYTKRGSAESLQVFGPSYREATAEQKAHRKHYGYVGRGLYSARKLRRDYETLMGKSLSRTISRKLTGAVNALPFGRGLYSGRGSYSNNLIAGGNGSVPMVSSVRDETGAVTIAHTEYICDIFGPGEIGSNQQVPFDNLSFILNPGLEATFPWLSQIAQNFEEYEFVQLIFHYTSTITDIGNSSNGQCGTLTMATDYNPSHKPFSDKNEMLGYAHSFSTKTTESMDHGVECDPVKLAGAAQKYVRSFPTPGEDAKTYDHGLFQLAISNSPTSLNGQAIGELRVTYKVILRKPKLFTSRGLGISRDMFVTSSNVSEASNGLTLWDGVQKIYAGVNNNLGCKLQSVNNGVQVIFPRSFVGPVKITSIVKCLEVVATAPQALAQTPGQNTNVVRLKEFYAENGSPNNFYVSGTVQVGGAANAPIDVIFTGCYFVNQKAGGVDNYVEITGTNNTAKVQLQIIVEEYNSYDKTTFEETTNLVDMATGVIVAGTAI